MKGFPSKLFQINFVKDILALCWPVKSIDLSSNINNQPRLNLFKDLIRPYILQFRYLQGLNWKCIILPDKLIKL